MPTGASDVTRLRAAGLDFLTSLDDAQRASAGYPTADPERYRWQYTPGFRGGLPLQEMGEQQRDAAMSLLEAALSASGFVTARAIIALETVLGDIERRAGRPGWQRREPGHYWFSVFGSPDDARWSMRVGGHHLCVHVTVVAGRAAYVPVFFGANPATSPDGSRLLADEEDLGRSFLLGLEEDQRAAALVSDEAPADIVTGNAARAEITAVPTGIRYADLPPGQRERLAALVGVYARRTAEPVPIDLTEATFAWLGSPRPGEGHYYAIRAGSALIEYDNTQDGANHIHTVVRDVSRDWGEDLIAEHHARHHAG
jgi:hypothetical protein